MRYKYATENFKQWASIVCHSLSICRVEESAVKEMVEKSGILMETNIYEVSRVNNHKTIKLFNDCNRFTENTFYQYPTAHAKV
jgi:hypothetical protein